MYVGIIKRKRIGQEPNKRTNMDDGCLSNMFKMFIGFFFCLFIIWMLPIVIWLAIGYICWLIGAWLYESLNENPKD